MIVDIAGVEYPLMLRQDTSDLDECRQVFDGPGYRELARVMGEVAGRVVDLGAYVGCTAAWFLSRWPRCDVVAVEPSRENWHALMANMAPYGDRVTVVYGAAWSRMAPLRMVETPFRDGREWSRQVRECEPGEASDCPGMTVPDLFLGASHVSLLKVDVEGAEIGLFEDAWWLDRVGAIAIELHDDAGPATETFMRAIDGHGFKLWMAGELTICRR